jgi:hypothetical protein
MREQSDRTQRPLAKEARRAVSRELARYHQSLLDAFSGDAASFFERIMEQAEHEIQAAREQGERGSAGSSRPERL